MKRADNTLRNGIIATVVGGIIIAVLQWLYGFLGVVFKLIKSSPLFIRDSMLHKVYLPVWTLILISTFALIPIISIIRRLITKDKTINSSSNEPKLISYHDLDQLQKDILRQLTAADGKALGIDDLYYNLQVNRLRIGDAIERMEEHGLITSQHHVLYGIKFGLTRGGRDVLMKAGLI